MHFQFCIESKFCFDRLKLPQVPSSTAVQTAPPGGMQAYAASPPSVPSSTAPSYAPGGLPTAQPPPLGFDMTATAGRQYFYQMAHLRIASPCSHH